MTMTMFVSSKHMKISLTDIIIMICFQTVQTTSITCDDSFKQPGKQKHHHHHHHQQQQQQQQQQEIVETATAIMTTI